MILLRTDSPPAPPADQMALDATLLLDEAAPPRLRFYRWDAPALTFGYAQRWRDVAPSFPVAPPPAPPAVPPAAASSSTATT